MSALFDDAERFESLIIVGDTARRVKGTTEDHVGPGTYRHVTGSVVRLGVWFHTSPFRSASPGPGEYSPPIISPEHDRGRTAKPSSGVVGRQAWDIRGSAGGMPLSYFRDGFSVSSSMGTTPRMLNASQVVLRDGVLLYCGDNNGHRTNRIGPGEYEGASNNQDPMTKRSYNIRAQNSQLRRERSLSFSGTSSAAKAFLSLASSLAKRTNEPLSLKEAACCRPDLHLLARQTNSAKGGRMSPTRDRRCASAGERRCMSPASALLSAMRRRKATAPAETTGSQEAAFGSRSGGTSSRSLSPKRSRGRLSFPICGVGGGHHGRAGSIGMGYVAPRPAFGHAAFSQHQRHERQRRSVGAGNDGSRGCRSLSPRGGGGASRTASSQSRAAPASPRRETVGPVSSTSAPSSPRRSRYRSASEKNYATPIGSATGAIVSGGGRGRGFGSDTPYTLDYFGLAGERGAWKGLEKVNAAREEMGIIEATKDDNHKDEAGGPAQGRGSGACGGIWGGGKRGRAPGSLLPEGVPAKGVCSPPKETWDDLYTSFDTVNRSAAAVDHASGLSNLPPSPSHQPLQPGST